MAAVVAGDWAGVEPPSGTLGKRRGQDRGLGGGESAGLGFSVAGVKGARGARGGRGCGTARLPPGVVWGALWKGRAGLTLGVDSV